LSSRVYAKLVEDIFIWLWIREVRGLEYAVLGAIILILYGNIPTLQSSNFGRVYAAYGNIFIILALIWQADHVVPDGFDIIVLLLL
jgi:small multidrug resistance family-3 protein